MDIQMLVLYILILLNQLVAYGALIYLAIGMDRGGQASMVISKPPKEKVSKKATAPAEESQDQSGVYLEYINNFEVEA